MSTDDHFSRAEALLYQNALITSLKKELEAAQKELSKVRIALGQAESEIQHLKHLLSPDRVLDLRNNMNHLKAENKSLRAKITQMEEFPERKPVLLENKELKKENKKLREKNIELSIKLHTASC